MIPLIILLCILIGGSFGCSFGNETIIDNSYTIDTPYEYPVTPDSKGWAELDTSAKREMCYVSLDTAKKMTTNALFITVLNYPYLADLYAFDSLSLGLETVEDRFPPLAELLERKDAYSIISSYIQECESNGSIDDVDYLSKTKYSLVKPLLSILGN
ncbi:MAG: hypothetical protein J6128_00200 [Clostridia bacterium]|nr:hypothetical protein [Clostridia bacterium]